MSASHDPASASSNGSMPKGHGHHYHSAPAEATAAFAWGVGLNIAFVVAEVIFGVLAHSLALIADAGHNLSDVFGLALAWGATILARRRPTPRRTYGLRRLTILAALANGILLMAAVGAVSWEAIRRLIWPGGESVAATHVIVLAAVGVAINGASAWLFARGSKTDLNVHGAFLHLLADAAVSVGVVVAGVIIWRTGWMWLDPAVSLLVSAVIAIASWRLLRQSFDLVMDAIPEGIDPAAVRQCLATLPGVSEVHDLHVWAMSTTETALTAHLARADAPGGDGEFLRDAARKLHDTFGIEHVTIQIEPPGDRINCAAGTMIHP
jgi:cobalt-zinc-cadmium efflux system protein